MMETSFHIQEYKILLHKEMRTPFPYTVLLEEVIA